MPDEQNNVAKCQEAIYSEEVADFVVEYVTNINEIANIYNIDCIQRLTGSYTVVHAAYSGSIVTDIAQNGYRAIPKLYGLMDTSNIEDIGVLRLRRLPFLDLVGTDVLVGIIDTGIDYQNPLFINADNTTRISAIWDQSIRSDKYPKGFVYGTEYTETEINEALKSDAPLSIVPSTDEDGHGTFLAAISAGNVDSKNDFTGIAPLASIVVVKLKQTKQYLRRFYGVKEGTIAYQENDIMLAVKYLTLKAIELKKPLSICIGLGTSSGEHDGSSPLSGYLDIISNFTGNCISVAAGNEGNIGHHYQGNLAYNTSEDIELKIGEKDSNFVIELWSQAPSVFAVGLVSPSGEVIQKIPARPKMKQEVRFVLEPTIINVSYALFDATSGNEVILLQFINTVPGIWRIRVFNEYNVGTQYNMWLPISQFVTDDTYFLRPDPYITLVETGTASKPISTATYNNKNNSIYISSSRGYTLTNQIKPDVTAPGVNVYGPTGRGQFGTKTGSSVAAAHTAGVAALLLQWGIVDKNRMTLNTSEIKALLIKGATRTDRIYPNREWGFGIINVYNSFESIRDSNQ